MTANRRIALNIIATYGRSLYAMICGLFASRWALAALGQVDYGLYGVVGGLTVFMCFLNQLMASAISRFYAFSVGEARKMGQEQAGLDNCIRWFNVSLGVHLVLPTVLLVVGYPSGLLVVERFLTIPPDRVNACIWVWRYTCISAWVGMSSVPFRAMYTAKQEIAELTIYGVAATTANILVLYHMVSHPGDWLEKYAFWMCMIAVVPQMIIVFRSFVSYSECTIVPRYFWNGERLKKLVGYAGARAFALSSRIFSLQGVAIVVNKWLGATRNASVTIGHTIAAQSGTLAGAFSDALYPAITNAAGEGRHEYARTLAFRACILSAISFLFFMLPLSVELEGIVRLWLKEPPIHVVELSLIMLYAFGIERLTDGHWMIILSYGKIFHYQVAESIVCYLTIVIVCVLLFVGCDVESVGWSMLIVKSVFTGVKLYYGRKLCRMSIPFWFRRVAVPLVFVSGLTIVPGRFVGGLMEFSLLRIVLTTCVMELVFVPITWRCLLTEDERLRMISKLRAAIGRVYMKGQFCERG